MDNGQVGMSNGCVIDGRIKVGSQLSANHQSSNFITEEM